MKEMKIQEENNINKKHIGAIVLVGIKTCFKLFGFKLKNWAGRAQIWNLESVLYKLV